MLYHGAAGSSAELIDRLRRAGTVEITADDPTLNPYWPRHGARSFVDPDGYHLIIAPT